MLHKTNIFIKGIPMANFILLIETKNNKGIVHNLSGILFMHEVNIISNEEFVDRENDIFFKRTEISGEIDDVKLLYDIYLSLDDGAKVQIIEKRKKDIVVFCTKEHHCLGDLLVRNEFNDFNANIKAVVSNHEILRSLTEKFNIPFHYIPHENKSREEHEKQIYDLLLDYNPEYLVLAKYMRILTPYLINKFPHRIINIHHSFLPAFIGANPYRQAYDRGVKLIGATSHIVTEDLDQGPIIAQNVIHVDHTKTPDKLSHEGKELEKLLLAKALEYAFEDRIFVTGNRTIIFD